VLKKAGLALVGIAALGLLALGGSAKPETALSCPASVPGLSTAAEAEEMMAGSQCYLARISHFPGGCGCADLLIMRYLCYEKGGKGWYYVNYWYCTGYEGPLDPDGGGTGKYSYQGGSTCGSPTWVDPITVVFTGGIYTDVQRHACDHGTWCFNDGGPQRFWSYGCWDQDANANSDEHSLTQYHMRIKTGRYWDGSYACDGSTYNLATPHHEHWGLPQVGCGNSGHSVYDNKTHPPGGFNGARDDIIKNWVHPNGPHDLLEWQYWGNVQQIRQSKGYGVLEGCWWASADGWVAIIGIWH